jgi:hypothetical protein
MNEPGLWLVALNAFVAVLVLLGALAGSLRLLTTVFPPARAATASVPSATLPPPAPTPDGAIDAATLAALQAAAAHAYPGGRVTHVVPADDA